MSLTADTAAAEPFRDPLDRRLANSLLGQGTHTEECWVCGRGLTEAGLGSAWWVHVVHGGDDLVDATSDIIDVADLGWFPVGSGCSHRVPKRFRRRSLA